MMEPANGPSVSGEQPHESANAPKLASRADVAPAPTPQPRYPIREYIGESAVQIDFGNGDGPIVFSTLIDDNPRFFYEWERLNSFRTWNLAYPSVKALAAAGFYYTNEGDKVKCFFCHLELVNWLHGDNPARDHIRWSSLCRMALNLPCGNIPMGQEPFEPPPRLTLPFLGRQAFSPPFAMVPSTAAPPEPRVIEPRVSFPSCSCYSKATRPIHASYETPYSRYLSFSDWPDKKSPSKHTLVEAGFFYYGKEDKTMCFFCGGGLRSWQSNDDPWEQHALWFQHCPFILFAKGPKFIEFVAKTHLTVPQPPLASPESSPEGSVTTDDLTEELRNIDLLGNELGTPIDLPDIEEFNLCKICFMNDIASVFIPCGHQLSCYKCAVQVPKCPVCRAHVHNVLRVFPC